MKNYLVFLLVSASLVSEGQIKKGSCFISGYFNFNLDDSKTGSTEMNQHSSGLNASYGYYVSPTVAIGLGATYSSSNYKNSSVDYSGSSISSETKNTTVTYNPFVGLFHPIAEHLYFYAYFNLMAGTGNQEIIYRSSTSNYSDKSKLTLYGAGINPGLEYFISDHFAIALKYGSLTYQYKISKPDDNTENTTTNSFLFNMGVTSVGVGLVYLMDCYPAQK